MRFLIDSAWSFEPDDDVMLTFQTAICTYEKVFSLGVVFQQIQLYHCSTYHCISTTPPCIFCHEQILHTRSESYDGI